MRIKRDNKVILLIAVMTVLCVSCGKKGPLFIAKDSVPGVTNTLNQVETTKAEEQSGKKKQSNKGSDKEADVNSSSAN
ncbi:hypothetical protein JYT31_01265 [Beggiatoa alba]|nr:hypothetical protein [Beggiatoa alba]